MEKKLTLHSMHTNNIFVDTEKAILTVPISRVAYDSLNGHMLVYVTVVEDTDTSIIVDIFDTQHQQGREIDFNCYRATFFFDEHGVPTCDIKILEKPAWLQCIHHSDDFVKNPLNIDAYPYLDLKDIPLYDGENLFITRTRNVYVKIVGGSWVQLKGLDWIESHLNTLPKEIVDEYMRHNLAQQLTE